MILVLNFSHPLTPTQREQLISQFNTNVEIRTIPVQIDQAHQLTEQIISIVDATDLTSEEWQTLPLIINPPGYAPAAMVLLVGQLANKSQLRMFCLSLVSHF